VVDAQSGHEKTITGLLAALAGVNVVYGSGMLEAGITFDLAQLVIDNEIAAMIKHVLRGIPVNEETLSVDLIKEIGIGRDYVSHESTYAHMKSQSYGDLIDRRTRESWEADGSTDIYQRARARVHDILRTHEPLALPEDVRTRLRSIVVEAEKEKGVYHPGGD